MVLCFVPDCNHRSDRNSNNCKFVSFPKDEKVKKKMARRNDAEPTKYSKVCRCHFKDGEPANLPKYFDRNKHTVFHSPEKKKLKPEKEKSNYNHAQGEEKAIDVSMPLISCNTDREQTATFSENDKMLQTSSAVASSKPSFPSAFYEAEKYFFERKIEMLTKEIDGLKMQSFGFSQITDDRMCLYYTGLRIPVFEVIVKLCSIIEFDYYDGIRVEKLTFKDQIFLSLIKLRLDLEYIDLGYRFEISGTTAFRIFNTSLAVLHKMVFQEMLDKIPSRRKNETSTPIAFASFTSCRIIVDCTKMRCEVPKQIDRQKLTFSSYKHFNTLKPLLVVAPNGTITFCSKFYPGSVSDKEIFLHCGIVKQLVSGDLILADKSFIIVDCLPPGVTINIPPFLSTPQFTPARASCKSMIAKARIHVERANARLKNYKILNFIPITLFDRASIILQVCAGLVNFQNPLIREV